MIQLYTIGFTGKTARQFFQLLQHAQVAGIVDTRVSNSGQLAGYSKGADLAFFAEAIGGMGYEHRLDFAPTKELLSRYRDEKISWEEYEVEYLNLLDMRQVVQKTDVEVLHRHCLLCSEHGPEHCHRRLLAEYFQKTRNDVEVVHLVK
jgi:uncharacterized protein (DUF488 family)